MYREVHYATPTGKFSNLYKDMLEQAHLLVAGKTGSGKSVVINGIITTALYRLPLDQNGGVQFILIDPKGVELLDYRKLPHTIKYATEQEDMLSALQYAVQVMEKRFDRMEARHEKKYTGSDIYIVIDEFADLMTTQGKAVVPIIQRLAQKGRAAKIHIILATQTPISEILPTKIKCNFDSRVGLRTRSAQDSRNIIGKTGLELLPEYGKGYYMTPKKERYYNIPMVPEVEINRLVHYWLGEGTKRGRIHLF